MRISVTQGDISKSRRNYTRKDVAWHCPIELALQRRLKMKNASIGVGQQTAFFHRYSKSVVERVALPLVAMNFIIDFDKGKQVNPFSFELPLEELKN